MEPDHIRFGGGATETILHPLVAVWMLIAVVLILTLPREKAITPFIVGFFMVPVGQVILVGGVHFTVLRILIMAAVARMVTSRRSSPVGKFPGGFNALDRVVILWIVSAFVVVTVQWMELQATIKFVSDLIDSLGGYLAVRFLIPDREGIRRALKAFAVVLVIQGATMMGEQFTQHNAFSFMLGGGSPEIRDGHIRAQGIQGALYGGVFAGVLVPLFLWLWTEGKYRVGALAGWAGCTAMVVASHASTSLMAYGGGILGLCFWPLRKQMRLIRWGLVATLVGLHLVMHGPVWSLIEHIDLTGGSSGYHRYMLIDTLIRHFGEWWLIGTRNNGAWGWESWDTCNQFVDLGVKGGLLTLVLYIMTLKRGFAAIGSARKQVSGNKGQEWFLWCLGSSLFANVIAQFGINYMVQLQLVLFPILACISVAAFEVRQATVPSLEMQGDVNFAIAPATAESFLPLGEAR